MSTVSSIDRPAELTILCLWLLVCSCLWLMFHNNEMTPFGHSAGDESIMARPFTCDRRSSFNRIIINGLMDDGDK